MSQNQSYYRSRSLEAREMAAAASSPNVVAIHTEMAERYELLAESGSNDTVQMLFNERNPVEL